MEILASTIFNRQIFWAIALLSSAIALPACTNSAIIISPVYNQLGKRIISSFKNMADFDDKQIKDYRYLTENFHFWHRRSELPKYAALLSEIHTTVATVGNTQKINVRRWLELSEQLTQSIRSCHPINFSNTLIRSFDRSLIDSIVDRRTTRIKTWQQRYYAESIEQRVDRRTENTIKWASRIGFDFSDEQEQLLRGTYTRQVSLRKEYFALSESWNDKLYEIIRKNDSPDLEKNMADHLYQLWYLLENAHPIEWGKNRELWVNFTLAFVRSMTEEQRTYAVNWIGKLSHTLKKIANEEVSVPILGTKRGCAVADGN